MAARDSYFFGVEMLVCIDPKSSYIWVRVIKSVRPQLHQPCPLDDNLASLAIVFAQSLAANATSHRDRSTHPRDR